MSIKNLGGMGWRRDNPDFRDYTPGYKDVKDILGKSKPLKKYMKAVPSKVDLRNLFSPIEDQENLGSCTANAGAGLFEYFQKNAYGTHIDASRIFLYKVTRNLMELTGDTGASMRETMKAMVLFGAPPEKYWSYDVSRFDEEPSQFCYSFAQNYKAIVYYRLDPAVLPPKKVLESVKEFIAAKLPPMFGFVVYNSIPGRNEGDEIPFPKPEDYVVGGHAIVAVGYDDKKKIGDKTGALLIRNSWSEKWGDKGYGWLPYAYVEQGLAVDFWTLIEADFVDTKLFK